MNTNWFVIVNPAAGNWKAKKLWPAISNELKKQEINTTVVFTSYEFHEKELAKKAVLEGSKNIIVVGGDGTLHHVINGIFSQNKITTQQVCIGVIPIGTGNDWIKTYNIPKNYKKTIEIIKQKNTQLQDIGVLTTKSNTTYFNNVAGIGYDGYVVSKLKKLKKIGGIAYLLSGFYGLLSYKKSKFKIEVNNQTITDVCLMTVFGICNYSGGGMQFTKEVNTTDGLLDISIVSNFSIIDFLIHIPKLYNGKITNHKKVTTLKTDLLTITPLETEPFIQADGELIAQGKVTVSILKEAISFVTPV